MAKRPMRFSLSIYHGDWARPQSRGEDPRPAVERTLAIAKAADAAGVHALWATEDPDGWDAFAVLSAIAAQTERIRLGTGVTSALLRHPNQLSASVTTLDLLSNGRAFLGIGRGEPDFYRNGLGIAVPNPPIRALERAVELLRAWWQPPYRVESDEPDPVFPVRRWERAIHPLTPPERGLPPIWIAAVGPKALAAAGRLADGVIFNSMASNSYLEWAVGQVRAAAAATGRDPEAIEFCYVTQVLVTDKPERTLEQRKRGLAMIGALPGMDRQYAEPGFDVPAIMAEVRRQLHVDEILKRGGTYTDFAREGDLDAALAAIPTELVDRLSVVGPAAHVRERLRELAEIGISEVFLTPPRAKQSLDVIGERLNELQALTSADTSSAA